MTSSSRQTATVQVRSRWDDCDRHGHVNNAGYVGLIRAAHDRAGMSKGELRALEVTYRQPVPPEVKIDVDVAIMKQEATHLKIAYALHVDGRPAADATALWQLADPPLTADLPPIGRDAGGQRFSFHQAVRSYEVGPDGAARPQAILQWLEHAIFRAAARAGWARQRMESAAFVTYVVGHHLVLGQPAREGDELTVTSRLIDLRRVSGTWHHEIRASDGGLIAADRARGAFLDLDGRARPAPAELLADLLRGEPSD
ncbi:MAG: thioesterase family protein [Chloroflexota bacterium]